MKFRALAPLLCGLANLAYGSGAVPELRVDGDISGMVDPGHPSEWKINYYYMSTGEPITDFEVYHEKPMHMIVVSRDLETFAHIHPDLDEPSGVFRIRINSQTNDPDNFMQPRVITKPGEHFVFTEVKLKESTHLVHGRHFVDGTGVSHPVPPPNPNVQCDGNPLVMHFDSSGAPGGVDSFYRMSFRCTAFSKGDFKSGRFEFAWESKAEVGYQPVLDLEPWLGMPAHAVAVSYAGDSVGAKIFRHMHAMPIKNGEVMFMLDEMHGGLNDGLYKLWAQFKHRGKVLTVALPFWFVND